MDFEFSHEQRQLTDSVNRLLNDRYAFEQRKAIIDSESGSSAAVWTTLAELGVLALPLSESAGGFGGGAVDLMGPMQAIGAALVVEPVLPCLIAARLVDRLGSIAQRTELNAVAAGQRLLAFAGFGPDSGFEADQPGLQCQVNGTTLTLSGEAVVVLGAPLADQFVVSARTRDRQLALFVVDARLPGLVQRRYRTLDNLRAADLSFESVKLEPTAILGQPGTVGAAIAEAIDFAQALLCAEALGAMQFACDSTLDYLKTRKQFGVPIGSFQALQHRIVDLYVELEQVKSMAALACSKVDAAAAGTIDARERAYCVTAARIKINEVARKVSQESVQLHGGMGMTEEMKISHTFRRLTMLAQQFGDYDTQLQRYIAQAV